MKYIFTVIIFALFVTGITSCESENPSSSNTTKELEVTTSKTSVGIYEIFTIKARMTNTPLSDVYVKIDFGDGQTVPILGAGSERNHAYDKTGTFTMTVTAYDYYTDAQLGTKTITMIVSDIIPSVTFTRDLIDITLQTIYDGRLEPITFPFTANAPVSKARFQFGDGSIDSSTPGHTSYYSYESPGTYQIIVDVYNNKGNYWASDTMTCIVRLPEVTTAMLTSANNVSVSLAVDGTSPIFASVQPFKHIDVGIGLETDSTKFSYITWNGNAFTANYFFGTPDSGNVIPRIDYKFSGTLSSDLKKLETMTVSVYDSTLPSIISSKYGYKLSHLELCGMNKEVIIYRAAYRPLSTFTNDEYLKTENISHVDRVGVIGNMLNKCVGIPRQLPYAYVVFTRK